MSHRGTGPRDFGQVWYAARAILHGQDPYSLIGPHLAFDWPAPLFYPLPAAVAAVPFAPFSAFWAPVIFTLVGGACFAWALMEHGYPPLLGFLSAAVALSTELAQWSPLLAAGVVLAPLSAIWVAKPTIGAALFLVRPSRWAVVGGVLLTLVAFATQPGWVSHWRGALNSTSQVRAVGFPFIAPVMLPGGFLALLALARWRRPEARLVAALACVPHTLLLYEAVPLFLVPRTVVEAEVLVVLSYVVSAFVPSANGYDAHSVDVSGQLITLLLYLPATFMVLRRPNEGALPAWLERRVAGWPAWVRGRPITR